MLQNRGLEARTAMDTAFRFEVRWNDNDRFQSSRRCLERSNSVAWPTRTYLSEDSPKLPRSLKAFPRQPSDTREVGFGAFGTEWAGGAVNMRFWCEDAAGHAVVEARIESDYAGTGKAQSVLLLALVEATAIDTFVMDLRRMEAEQR